MLAREAQAAGFVLDRAEPRVVAFVRDAVAGHVFADPATCVCGYAPGTGEDWDAHLLGVAVTAVAVWLLDREQVAAGGRLVVA